MAAVTIDMRERDPEARRLDLVVAPEVVFVAGLKVAARLFEGHAWRPLIDSPYDTTALAVSSDGRRVAASGCATPKCERHAVRAWNAGDRAPVPLGPPEPPGDSVGLAFFAGDQRLAAVGRGGQVVFWDMSSGTGSSGPGLPLVPDALALRAQGQGGLLAAVAGEGKLLLWDVVAGARVSRDFAGPGEPIRALAIDPAATRLAAGVCRRPLPPETEPHYPPRASNCARGGLYLWDLASGATVGAPVEGHDGDVTQLEFSPDGSRLLSVGDDGSVYQWSTAGGLHEPRGREDGSGRAQMAAYTADGAVLATIGCGDERCSSAEAELRLWHGESLEAIGAATRGHSPLPRAGIVRPRRVGFVTGGAALVSASADGVSLWDISVEGMRRRACALAGRDLEAGEWTRHRALADDAPEICPRVPRPDQLYADNPAGLHLRPGKRARRRGP